MFAAGGQPGGCGCNRPLPRPGRWFFFPCGLQLGPFIIEKKKRERERESKRMTRPAGWKIKRLKKKRARLFFSCGGFG